MQHVPKALLEMCIKLILPFTELFLLESLLCEQHQEIIYRMLLEEKKSHFSVDFFVIFLLHFMSHLNL